jgi:hypothetical protein
LPCGSGGYALGDNNALSSTRATHRMEAAGYSATIQESLPLRRRDCLKRDDITGLGEDRKDQGIGITTGGKRAASGVRTNQSLLSDAYA